MFSATIYATCMICRGSRVAFGEACRSCADPDPALARKMLERLTVAQMAFLRAFGHTLAHQPVTPAEHDAHLIEPFVEDDDAEYDQEEEVLLIPPTRHWFAGGMSRFGPSGEAHFISYNPYGLLLRECLIAGADALVRT